MLRGKRLFLRAQPTFKKPKPRSVCQHACDQSLECSGNRAPIVEPVAWEAHQDVGSPDAPFIKTGTGKMTGAVAGAAHEKGRGFHVINQIFAIVRRSVTEGEHGQPVGVGLWLGCRVAWIYAQCAIGRGKRVTGGGDAHEHARKWS